LENKSDIDFVITFFEVITNGFCNISKIINININIYIIQLDFL